MLSSFPTFRSTRQSVSAGTLSALVQLQRQDLLTGLIDIMYPGAEQAFLFFNLGVPFSLYFFDDGEARKILPTQWSDIFARPNGAAAVLSLSGDALRICLMALEADHKETEELLLRPAGLAAHIEQVKAQETVSLLRVRDDAFNGLILVAGSKVAVQDALVFSASGVMSGSKALAHLVSTEDRLLRVTLYEFLPAFDFIQEYALRVAFVALTQPVLVRFEQLAGDMLTDLLGREVNNYAYHQGWKIQFFGNQVLHRQFFSEAAEAAVVYRGLYRVVQHYFQRVVGRALAASMVTEGIGQLPGSYRAALAEHNFIADWEGV
jgi:hypothetical protein